jgi:DNA-binding LacI/PurR family transcriptional regulator
MVNIKDVAKLAGVSISSVSRVLNNRPGVNSKKRKIIEQVISEKSYRPNLLARELIHKRTNLIGIILPSFDSNYADIITGAMDAFYGEKYGVTIALSRGNIDEEIRNFNLFSEKQVDGILFFVSELTERHRITIDDISRNLPVFMIGKKFDTIDVPYLMHNEHQGAQKAMEYLIECGHKKIGFISGPSQVFSAQQRFSAYLDTLRSNNLPVGMDTIAKGDFSLESGYNAMKQIIEVCTSLPSAVFGCNDLMAIGALKALHEKGIRVPDDISIIGFDNIPFSEFCTPALTTVQQNNYELGNVSGKLLLDRVTNKNQSKDKILPGQELIIRGSVKKLTQDPVVSTVLGLAR